MVQGVVSQGVKRPGLEGYSYIIQCQDAKRMEHTDINSYDGVFISGQ
jgi:hypothetical protein